MEVSLPMRQGYDCWVSQERNAEVQRLFDELIELEPAARAARLAALAPPPVVSSDLTSLLAAAERAGDFLGVLGAGPCGDRAHHTLVASRYRLDRPLGSGATGDVHLAWDTQLERPVALKFLRASSDAAGLARFVTEARAAARLDHPHIATVHDIGETERGAPFIAMGYYAGATLRDRIARGPLAPPDALHVATQIASALAAAHAAGIVHRDVKPANVLFDADGAVKLTDFGAAKLLATHDVTSSGDTIGTVAYMSPEQARGDAVDGRTDLWALGVVLYEMLLARRPFVGARSGATLDALVHDDPLPLSEDDAQITPALRALIAALLSKDAAHRPANASTVRGALEQIAAGEDAAAIHATPNTGIGALPVAVTSFIGREHEIETACALLDGTRLLTLTGPGGTGKTRLAMQLATAIRERYPDGIWFVPLADVSDAQLVPSIVAQALGVRDLAGGVLSDRVLSALRTKRLLLIMDNFEHVLDAALFVSRVLAACPGVSVLATSRAPLAVQGEQEFPVPPLVTPALADTNAAANEAVRLFVQRARAVRPDFALDDDGVRAVAEICRQLDGLPLALELAAARAKLLSPRAILARLAHRFDLLRTDTQDRPARHGTMREVIAWSYVLLTDAERAMFDRLAIFAGGIALDAAEAVAPARSLEDGTRFPTLDLLASLCNKSLLRQEDQPDGEPRFVMLETMREFGLERLRASGDETAARHAHRVHYLALAEHAATELRGPGQIAWVDRLEREYANIRIAIEDALDDAANGSATALHDAARLAVALHRLWFTRGPLIEGVDYLRRVVAAADVPGTPVLDVLLRAKLLSSAAQLAGTRSMFADARTFFARSLALYRAAGDQHGVATTLNNLAWQVWNIGDLTGGEGMSAEAMTMHHALGNELGVALSRNNLAWIAMERGQFALAETHFDAVIAWHLRSGDRRAAAFAVSWLGMVVARRGDLARALELHERALEIGEPVADHSYRTLVLSRVAATRHALDGRYEHITTLETVYLPDLREAGRLWPIAAALTALGTMLYDEDELTRARPILLEALAVRHRTGGVQGVGEAQLLLGTIQHRLHDDASAVALLGTALRDARDYGAVPIVLDALDTIAMRALDGGRAEYAMRLLAASDRARQTRQIPRAIRDERAYRRTRTMLATMLNAPVFAHAHDGESALSLEDACALALGDLRAT